MDDMNGLLGTFEAFLRVLMLWPFLQGVMAGFFILHCFSVDLHSILSHIS